MNKKTLLKKCSPNFVLFFEWAEEYLRKNNKKVVIVNARKIKFDGGFCGGWCDGKEIVIAGRGLLFEETFVHEFSHMMQAIEKSPFWTKSTTFWDDLEKQEINIQSWKSIIKIIALERDCERRALALSKKWELFDNEIYAQRANIYLFYYHLVFLRGEWIDSTGLYNSPQLNKLMPKTLAPMSALTAINMDLMVIFDQCVGKKRKKGKKSLPKPATLS